MRELDIAILAGDGIGPEVMAPCVDLLNRVAGEIGGFRLRCTSYDAGADLYRRTGVSLPDETIAAAAAAHAILLGAMGLPNVRYPNGTEVVPQIELRERFGLYAGVRPVRALPGVRKILADARAGDMDFVLVRESTEGLFAARTSSQRSAAGPAGEAVFDTMRISRGTCERLFDFAFKLAGRRGGRGRQPRVTCVDKANVLPSMAFFREIFLERAAVYPDVRADCMYVDAAALRMVSAPWEFDVLVTENMFGDILSDLGAGLIGGMGMAPSADIGEAQAVFQPCHGTAPDIAGRGVANPTAMFLSAAMMLDWLADRHDLPACRQAGDRLTRAIEAAFASGDLIPCEHGGNTGTAAIASRVARQLESPRN